MNDMDHQKIQADVNTIEQSIGLPKDNITFAANVTSFIINYDLVNQETINWLLNEGYIAELENAQKQYEESGARSSIYYLNSEDVKLINFEDKKYVLKNQWTQQKDARQSKLAKFLYKLVDVNPTVGRTSQPQNINNITNGKNFIIYGAPGTGKSHWVEEEYGKKNLIRVVFHPEYTYFDFVGQYRPCPVYDISTTRKFVTVDGKEFKVKNGEGEKSAEPFIDYSFVPGPFTDVLVKAWNDKENMYTLLIEELNRADAPAVFGDVFQLLDRKENGESEYGIKPSAEWAAYLKTEIKNEEARNTLIEDGEFKVKIPFNMNIIATMNSADQGVHVLDTAFKRRWDYEFMSIDKELQSTALKDIKFDYADKKNVLWREFIKIINDKLSNECSVQEDRLVGPFFVKPELVCKENGKNAVKKILFYLWDDVLRNNSGRSNFFADGIKNMSQLYSEFDTGKDVLNITDSLNSVQTATDEQP